MKINTKIMLLVALSLVSISLVAGGVAIWKLQAQGKMAIQHIESLGNQMIKEMEADERQQIKVYRHDLIESKKQYLRSEVQTALSGLTKFIGDLEALQTEGLRGETDEALRKAMEEEAKQKAADLIKHLRYGPQGKDYFWINDMTPTMIMHPYKPQLNGKNLSEVKDPTGKRLFIEFVKVCKEKGEGFVKYQWPKYGSDKPQPKLSFVKTFKKWNWIIGTGIYTDSIEKAVKARSALLKHRLDVQKRNIQRLVQSTEAQVEKRVRRTVMIIGGACLCILLITLLGAYFFSTHSISKPIVHAIDTLQESAEQVASASGQVSEKSQILSEGASEQAASLEETSSSLEEMSSITKQSADGASQANNLMKQTTSVVEDANTSMEKLTSAMDELASSSEKTADIIKTIDEIAFQTNLLALNAAVEAARAGEAGAGFAVVADEVRNLAMRAAEAAKNTADMIEENIGKIKQGSQLVEETNEAFSKVADRSGKVAQLLDEIAEASTEQSSGIDQITKAVAEMDKVVQQNAASAEELASASEQLNTQVHELKAIVPKLGMLVGKGPNSPGDKSDVADTIPPDLSADSAGSSRKRNYRKDQSIPIESEDFQEF